MTLRPANYFQLFDEQQADFQLGVNSSRLKGNEADLWRNIEVYARVIKENGLEDKLKEAHEEALRNYAETENERWARHQSRRSESDSRTLQTTVDLLRALQ